MIGFSGDRVQLSGTVWAVPGVSPKATLQVGPYTGSPSEVCELLAADIPEEHGATVEMLEGLLLAGRRSTLLHRWRQAIAIQTPAGSLIATFGPPGAQPDGAGTRRPLRVRFVDVEWTTHRGRLKRRMVGPGRRGLGDRIAAALPDGFKYPPSVRDGMDRAVAADRGARQHKVLLRAPAEHPTAAAVVVIVERW